MKWWWGGDDDETGWMVVCGRLQQTPSPPTRPIQYKKQSIRLKRTFEPRDTHKWAKGERQNEVVRSSIPMKFVKFSVDFAFVVVVARNCRALLFINFRQTNLNIYDVYALISILDNLILVRGPGNESAPFSPNPTQTKHNRITKKNEYCGFSQVIFRIYSYIFKLGILGWLFRYVTILPSGQF